MVDLTVQVEMPELLVSEQEPTILLVPLTEMVGKMPTIAVPSYFFKVIVTVEDAEPSAKTGPVAVSEDWLPLGVSAVGSLRPPEVKSTGIK
jgi:hypothetical protein